MEVTTPFRQDASGSMTYPQRGTLNRLLFKTPLIWWRMGLGGFLGDAMIVLTTWGRKSHLARHTMLSYTPMECTIYVGAGWGASCDWYQNLLANPQVLLQVWSEKVMGMNKEVMLPAIARRVTDEEEFRTISRRLFETGVDTHFRPWLKSLGIAYDHEDMVAKRDRVHQVALDLKPIETLARLIEQGYPPPMETDLRWMWAVMAGSFGLGWLVGRRRR